MKRTGAFYQLVYHFTWSTRNRQPMITPEDGYGVIALRQSEIPKVVEYIRGQKEHHRQGKLSALLERTQE